MEVTPAQLEQLQETVKDVVHPKLDAFLSSFEDPVSSRDAREIALKLTSLILIELAAKLAENDPLPGALTYRISKHGEACLPDDATDSVSGWLMAPEAENPLRGKASNDFFFDAYGAASRG